jgi:ribonucleotide reductase beta subunit family protein with ferritin-like domain
MKEEEEWTYAMFDRAVNEEKRWADYLFKDGSMIGLNDKLLQQYVEWIANRRLKAIGLNPNTILQQTIIHFLGHSTGFPLKVSRWLPRKQK